MDAASFVVAGVLMISLHVPPASAGFFPVHGRLTVTRIAAKDPVLRSLAASFFCSAAAITALQAVLVVAAAQRFGQDTDVGWLYAAVGAGGVAGSLVLLRWKPRPIGAGGISIGFLLEVVPLGIFALVGWLIPALALLAFSTAAAALYQTRGQTALQQRVPAEVLGRVTGLTRLLLYAGMLTGAVAAVALVDVVGWSTLVVGAAAVSTGVYLVASVGFRIARPASRRSHPRRDTAPARVRSDGDGLAGFLLDRQADGVAALAPRSVVAGRVGDRHPSAGALTRRASRYARAVCTSTPSYGERTTRASTAKPAAVTAAASSSPSKKRKSMSTFTPSISSVCTIASPCSPRWTATRRSPSQRGPGGTR